MRGNTRNYLKILVLAAAFGLTGGALAPSVSQADESGLLREIGCGADMASSGAPVLPRAATEDGRLDVLIVGSSSTAGVGAGGTENSYPALSARLFKARAQELGLSLSFQVTPRGISGERAAGALARLEREIDAAKPDLLVWQVGTNDAVGKVPLIELERTVLSGVEMARARGVGVVLVDPQFYPKVSSDKGYAAVVSLIDQVAERIGAPVVRRFARMRRALDGGEEKLGQLLAKDRFHMSPLGHECLARDLVATILPILKTADSRG